MNWKSWSALAGLLILIGLAIWFTYRQGTTAPILLLGCGSLLTAVMALYGERLRAAIWHPYLELFYSHTFPYCKNEPFIDLEIKEAISAAYYFRAALRNGGSVRAEKVEVLAIDLHKIVDGKPPEFIRRYSSNLAWSSTGQAVLDGLSPGVDRFVTIGKILHPNGRKKIKGEYSEFFLDTIAFSMEMPARGATLAHLLPPGTYELGLMVVAANCRPARYVARLRLGSVWHDDLDQMLRESVTLDTRPARRALSKRE